LHVYIIGKTGTGKSTLIETMAFQDLERGNG
jgi:ABC-type transport system involved in cytochrome bd biosynthesis fused ATPase/permease subunit